jgi:hypothetical protein
MKYARDFLSNALVGGVLVLLPVYLAVLAKDLLSLMLVLILCFVVGVAVRTPRGARAARGYREVDFRQADGLRTVSKSHAATGW